MYQAYGILPMMSLLSINKIDENVLSCSEYEFLLLCCNTRIFELPIRNCRLLRVLDFKCKDFMWSGENRSGNCNFFLDCNYKKLWFDNLFSISVKRNVSVILFFFFKGMLCSTNVWRALMTMKEVLINFQKVTNLLELTNLWMVVYIAKSGHQVQKQCFSQVISVSISGTFPLPYTVF